MTNWDDMIGKEVGLNLRPSKTHPAEVLWCVLAGANNNGVFVRPSEYSEPFALRFYPWGQIAFIGLRVERSVATK